MSDERVKFVLDEPEIPTHWINLMADLPGDAPPPLHPGTQQPAGPDDLTPIFPMALILQEVSAEPEIEIPEPVREAYKLWRPTPLYRARRLERELDTPAHIYYKYEGVSPPGSHKPNTAVAAGVRERPGRDQEAHDRDRRGPVGIGARVRVPAVRARVRGVDGRLELRPEALPPLDDGDVGGDRPSLALGRDRGGPLAARAHDGLARHRDLRGGRGGGAECGHELLARVGAQPRAAAPDRDRTGGARADGDGRRGAGHRDRVRRRRLELRRADVPVPAPGDPRRGRRRGSSRPSRPPVRR